MLKQSKKWIKCVCYLWMVLIQLEIYGDNVFAHRIRNKEKGMTETVLILNCKFIEIKHKFNKFSTIYWKSKKNCLKIVIPFGLFYSKFPWISFFSIEFQISRVCMYIRYGEWYPPQICFHRICYDHCVRLLFISSVFVCMLRLLLPLRRNRTPYTLYWTRPNTTNSFHWLLSCIFLLLFYHVKLNLCRKFSFKFFAIVNFANPRVLKLC